MSEPILSITLGDGSVVQPTDEGVRAIERGIREKDMTLAQAVRWIAGSPRLFADR